jgi:hypothetical protein
LWQIPFVFFVWAVTVELVRVVVASVNVLSRDTMFLSRNHGWLRNLYSIGGLSETIASVARWCVCRLLHSLMLSITQSQDLRHMCAEKRGSFFFFLPMGFTNLHQRLPFEKNDQRTRESGRCFDVDPCFSLSVLLFYRWRRS